MKFEQWDRRELKIALMKRNWFQVAISKQKPTVAGQLHSWFVPSMVKGAVTQKRTLRNAARIAGLIQ